MRRDRYDLTADVLEETQQPIGRTQLMYRTRTSYTQLMKVLNSLMQMGFIEDAGKGKAGKWDTTEVRLFQITEKGRTLLRKIHEIQALLG